MNQGQESRFEHMLFVCTNEGRQGDNKRRCGKHEAATLLDRLKAAIVAKGYKGKVRATRSGCLDLCARGCAAVVYSRDKPARETWYTHLTPDDAEPLLESHVVQGTSYAGARERFAAQTAEKKS